jgi:hypothetical protein
MNDVQRMGGSRSRLLELGTLFSAGDGAAQGRRPQGGGDRMGGGGAEGVGEADGGGGRTAQGGDDAGDGTGTLA